MSSLHDIFYTWTSFAVETKSSKTNSTWGVEVGVGRNVIFKGPWRCTSHQNIDHTVSFTFNCFHTTYTHTNTCNPSTHTHTHTHTQRYACMYTINSHTQKHPFWNAWTCTYKCNNYFSHHTVIDVYDLWSETSLVPYYNSLWACSSLKIKNIMTVTTEKTRTVKLWKNTTCTVMRIK